MKTATLSIFAIVSAVSLVSVSSVAAPALAYEDHDYDVYDDYVMNNHGDISGYYLQKCG